MIVGFPESNPLDAAVGARVRHWREQRGLTVDELAQKLNVSREHLNRAEHGRAHLDSAQLHRATLALGLPVWTLVGERERTLDR